MKAIIRHMLPGPVLGVARKLWERLTHRNRPRLTSYCGNAMSVLQCCIAYNDYGGYCLPSASIHRPAAQKVLSGGIWEPDTIDFMVRHSGDGDIVHAGTFFGDFIPALSRSCVNGAKVWAFEPNAENYRCALITVSMNNLTNVEIFNVALGAQKGSLWLMIYDEAGRALGGASRVVSEAPRKNQQQFVQVDVVRIDDAVPSNRRISMIQLDVEGLEQSVLGGAMETIKRCRPVLILESIPSQDWLAENILKIGYRVEGRLHDNTVLAIA